ncbi:hypothetical protein JD844_000944 [Phrynosoma platyrhinos]|uniref:Nucleolar protein 9 n=1 Tax=Phrynosoma platyrhinos TaxID=52577 RepID=A0ABQ7T9N7_PHRPL|nr:hypothetical protein JD844_000944 [Phrynosoma platyrhinos]
MGVPPHPQKGGKRKKERRKRSLPSASDGAGGLFVSNVLEEAEAVALPLALDTAGSLLLQALVPSASSPSLCCFLRALIPSLRLAACHSCGAHILEAVLLRAPLLIKDGAEDSGTLEDLILELGRAVQKELSVFALDAHGSFVVRTLLQVLGGVRVGSDGGRGLPGLGISSFRAKRVKTESDGPLEFEVPDSFFSLLREFSDLCLQVALEVLHRKLPDVCSELCHSVISYLSSCNPAAGQSPLLVFLKDATCSRVLDKVLEVSDPKALRSFYKAHIKGQLRVLAEHGMANFTLQRLIQAASRKLLGQLFEELSPGVEEIMAHEHLGVNTSRPLSSVSYHGSLMLQHLLHFADPSMVLRSLGAMTPKDLVTLACDPAGSHVFDALLASPSVPEKQRRKVLRLLKGCYLSLACNKHGSRVLDAIWSRASLPAKQEMAQELAEHEPQLRHDPFGHHVARNFALTHFLKRRRDWDRHQETEKKRRELFAGILDD